MGVSTDTLVIQNLKWSNAIIENQIADLTMDLNTLQKQSTDFTSDKQSAIKNAKAMYGEDSSAYEDIKEQIEDDFDYKMALIEDEITNIESEKTVQEAQHSANDQIIESTKNVREKNIKTFGYFKSSD